MSATAVALLCVLLLPWESCCEDVKNYKEMFTSHIENLQSHRESLIKWKKSVAKDVLNFINRSSFVKNVKEGEVWKKLKDFVHKESHRYTGEKHGPTIGRLLRFVKQSATDSDLWEAQLWKAFRFQEALIYDPPGYVEPQMGKLTHKRYEYMISSTEDK